MKQNEKLQAAELMDIIATQLRKLASMDLNDRNIGKCVSQSKEVGNLAGKAIQLSYFESERQRAGTKSKNLLSE